MIIKRIFIIILGIFLLSLVVITIAQFTAFQGWSDGTVIKGDDIVKSSLGDEFLLQYVTKNFPDYQTSVTIMDAFGKDKLSYFHIEGDFYEPKIDVLINDKDLRCYKIYSSIFYKTKNEEFKGIDIISQTSPIDLEYNKNTKEFVDIAKKLVAKKEWKLVKDCGKLLLNAGDEEIKKTLERYALGKFSDEELEINKNSDIKKDDMTAYAKQVLEAK
ncbi:MAG: hypothetical protein Q8942_09130 [Bacillota bacterium]|nr:hypothetical protein [Bacillota bacterium]